MANVIERALADVGVLAEAGFSCVMIENFGDTPYFAERVPPITIAAMSAVAGEIGRASSVSFGINVLRNDGEAAVAIAAATGADLIRINVLSGMMITDQGPIVGRAAEVDRLRTQMAPGLTILADVFVKHAAPPPGMTLEQSAIDTWERAGADALIISGTGTGRPVNPDDLKRVKLAVPDAPIAIGSGVTAETVSEMLELVDSVIVGSALKPGGDPTRPVDRELAHRFIEAAA